MSQKQKSIDGNKDIFGNQGPFNEDHKWPVSKGGSNIKENKIKLSIKSNQEKGDKTKGTINGIRFSVLRCQNKKQEVYGEMQIKDGDEWIEIY